MTDPEEVNRLDQLKRLKKNRGNIKRQLTNLEVLLNFINSETDLETLSLSSRLQKHLESWDKFDTIQSNIESLDTVSTDEIHEGERNSFEDKYYRVEGKLKKFLKKMNSSETASNTILAASQSTETISNPNSENPRRNSINVENLSTNTGLHSSQSRPAFQLPKLQTPEFHGTFDTWLQFHDTFKSMCHDNTSISNIEKFLYLKSCVKGEAAEVIASLETSNENYVVAWELLKSRFDNRKHIVDSHYKELLDIPSISKEYTIRSLLDNVQKRIRALKALEQPVETWSTLLIFLIREKLNHYTREKWEETIDNTQVPNLNTFLEFLERRAILEGTQALHKNQNQKPTPLNISKINPNSRNKFNPRQSQTFLSTNVNSKTNMNKINCCLCSEQHTLANCNKFLNLSPQARYDTVKKNNLCHNCFYKNHKTFECRRSNCSKCQKPHNVLLHFDKPNQTAQDSPPVDEKPVESTSCHVRLPVSNPAYVILGTAILKIVDGNGQYRTCRALLDSCSQCNSITEKFASELGLNLNKLNVKLKGVENLETRIKYSTTTKIRSRINDNELKMSFLVFKEISTQMPMIPLDRKMFSIPEGIVLADPEFDKPADIDILIGAEQFYNLLGQGRLRLKGQTAILQESTLGWIVAGKYSSPDNFKKEYKISCQKINFKEFPLLWELGPENSLKFHSKEEQDCEEHYVLNTVRNNTGSYIVKLPFNKKKELLGNSFNTAVQRFHALERKFETNPQLKLDYFECIQGYLDEGHMSLASDNEQFSKSGYFLHHHAVLKSNSVTTKTRVVFDGSAKSSSGISLNDTLMVGPTIQQDLFSIVTRFRTLQFVFTADIQQMYRQISVSPEDFKFQKILWRQDPKDKIETYNLKTVTFGTACAPFLAIRTLHQLANDEQKSHPITASILKEDFFVDDCLTGSNNFQDALHIRDDLIELLKKGNFVLRKWSSNCPELLQGFPSEISNSHLCLDPTETVKTLGLHWDPVKDSFSYSVKLTNAPSRCTKRFILSETAKLFDPLGLLGPITVTAKIIIQQLWKAKLSWDDPVPCDVQEKWNEYKNQLTLINNIKFKRCIVIPDAIELQLHGFCDSSEKAYGACLYLRSINKNGETFTALICSKSRVAPLKIQTLPRLELCAAALLIELSNSILPALKLQFAKTFFWTDSTIVLNWINSSPDLLKTFVANRVSEIHKVSQPSQWRHVRTQDNPADALSRGQNANIFLQNKLWLEGPTWLKQNAQYWPNYEVITCEIPEKRKIRPILTLKIQRITPTLLERYSKLRTLINVVSYCLRFVHNLKIKDQGTRTYGPLAKNEKDSTTILIIKSIQFETFSEELKALSRNEQVSSKSKLRKLSPFLDQGIIKVGGRLNNVPMNECQKHPIILPKGHHVTTLIIRHEHLTRSHAGVHSTLYGIRENFWIVDGRNTVRRELRKCITCFRAKPPETEYLMGNLPNNRISFNRPFNHSGVDYCGPFFIKEHRHRNRSKLKTYVAIFVCLATKAVHLELASDLTTDAFIACLKRFISRRGNILSISSDNATNFVGANNELKELYKHIESLENDNDVKVYLSETNIKWNFIPPRAPHFGGLWEAAVKSFKYHFTRVSGISLLTYEQLQTYVVEIEAILNSRPLTPMSSDPNDLRPLTPGHFLIGTSMTSLPQENLQDISVNRLNNWQLAQQMRQHFWTRWSKEYVNELITRSKWQKNENQSNIKPGTLLLIREDNLPPMYWKLGRIFATHPGQDGIIRTVTIKTATGSYKRSLKNVALLPMDD